MAPEALSQVLRPIQSLFDPADHPDLLIGLGSPDDAAVYRLDDDRALIVTTDFFTPIVDDAYDYGAIAAANALSDVYAMGGRPLLALNVAAFPDDLPTTLITEILRGAAETVREANAVIAGGHTIKDKEPKVGLAVVGEAHPERLLTKSGAQPGDLLLLTKPLGTGVLTTALKNDKISEDDLEEAVRWMKQLNRTASEAAVEAGAQAASDVTGFGLLGHGVEMAAASGVSFHIEFERVPFMTHAKEQSSFPGGTAANREAYLDRVEFASEMTYEQQMLLFDAQTSGGLLISLPVAHLERFKRAMGEAAWWHIGDVQPPTDEALIVVG